VKFVLARFARIEACNVMTFQALYAICVGDAEARFTFHLGAWFIKELGLFR
jgi:hypothetical protein